jgi:hypothetical protein
MKNKLNFWQFAGFAFVSIAGTLLHFLYEWMNESVFIAPFSGVNESTWEHMKLFYFPIFLFALIQNIFSKDERNFWCVKLIGILTGLLTIPMIYYTYNGAIGKSPDWVNISIFFIAVAFAFLFETILFKNSNLKCKYPVISFSLICIIGILFVIFTFFTPRLPLFQDPVTGEFGIGI